MNSMLKAFIKFLNKRWWFSLVDIEILLGFKYLLGTHQIYLFRNLMTLILFSRLSCLLEYRIFWVSRLMNVIVTLSPQKSPYLRWADTGTQQSIPDLGQDVYVVLLKRRPFRCKSTLYSLRGLWFAAFKVFRVHKHSSISAPRQVPRSPWGLSGNHSRFLRALKLGLRALPETYKCGFGTQTRSWAEFSAGIRGKSGPGGSRQNGENDLRRKLSGSRSFWCRFDQKSDPVKWPI